MQRDTRPPRPETDAHDPIARQAELIRSLQARAQVQPDDLELRERLKAALDHVDLLVRRRDGWSDDGKPPAA